MQGIRSSAGVATRELDGACLSPTTVRLISVGVVGGLLFAAVYLIEGVTRPGYVAWQQPISALSLGPGGWLQQINFFVFGVLTLVAAIGWRQALTPGPASVVYPVLRAIEGVALIVDAFFSQDPAPGYPVGALTLAHPTTHGIVHTLFAMIAITAIAVGDFALAWRFAYERRWRGWAVYAVVTGILTIVLIAVFGSMSSHLGSPAGLFERLATGINSVFGLLLVARLLADRRRTPSASVIEHA